MIDGTVCATITGQNPTLANRGFGVGKKFINPAGLRSLGGNIFQETVASGTPSTGIPGAVGLGTITQGSLEMSNVSVVDEMVSMITAQRAYEINSRRPSRPRIP